MCALARTAAGWSACIDRQTCDAKSLIAQRRTVTRPKPTTVALPLPQRTAVMATNAFSSTQSTVRSPVSLARPMAPSSCHRSDRTRRIRHHGAASTKGPSGNKCIILAADAYRLAALLVACIRPVCALLPPCQAGASTPRDGALIPGRALTARGESLAAFDGRCIPAGRVAPRSNTPGILGRRALPAGRLARLGATPDFHHWLLSARAGVKNTSVPAPHDAWSRHSAFQRGSIR